MDIENKIREARPTLLPTNAEMDAYERRVISIVEEARRSCLEEVVEWCTKECDKQEAIIQRDMSSEQSHIFHTGVASGLASVVTHLTTNHHD
jgi:hypothetical protein